LGASVPLGEISRRKASRSSKECSYEVDVLTIKEHFSPIAKFDGKNNVSTETPPVRGEVLIVVIK
jgi:hypothetical protein